MFLLKKVIIVQCGLQMFIILVNTLAKLFVGYYRGAREESNLCKNIFFGIVLPNSKRPEYDSFVVVFI